MLKKSISFLVALSMILSVSASASAAETAGETGTSPTVESGSEAAVPYGAAPVNMFCPTCGNLASEILGTWYEVQTYRLWYRLYCGECRKDWNTATEVNHF